MNDVAWVHAVANIGVGAVMSFYLIVSYRKTLDELKQTVQDLRNSVQELSKIIQERVKP